MPVQHLLQTEIVQSEIVDDSNPYISTTNLQDDLNQIRASIRKILGRSSWLDLDDIITIDYITNWFNDSWAWLQYENTLNNSEHGNLVWHPVIFNSQKFQNFLDGTETLDNAVSDVYNFYSQVRLLNVAVREIILPAYLHQFINKQTDIQKFIKRFRDFLRNAENETNVRISILFNLTKILNTHMSSISSSPTFFELYKYSGIDHLYFSDIYEAKVCTDISNPSSCTNATKTQINALKNAIINGATSVHKAVGFFVRNSENLNKIFDTTFFNAKRKYKNLKFRLITNFFNIYSGQYTEDSETYNTDVLKFISSLENSLGLEVFYLDDLVWLQKYNPSNMPTVGGIFAFNNTGLLSSLFGSSISSIDKIVQALKASKRKIALFYDYEDNNLSTFTFSSPSFLFNLSDSSITSKYIVFNNLNAMTEEINDELYEKVATLTKNKHYIFVSPGEKIVTDEGILKEIYIVSDFSANTSIKITKSKFGELARNPSLTITIDASNNRIIVGSSNYSAGFITSSYNFLKIQIGLADIKIYVNNETTALHTSNVVLDSRSVVLTLENTDATRSLRLYGIFKR
jgi:hypothetical protein